MKGKGNFAQKRSSDAALCLLAAGNDTVNLWGGGGGGKGRGVIYENKNIISCYKT